MNATAARKKQEHAFPLALATPGEKLRIAAIRAGKGLGRRLYDIGLPIGVEVEVIQREGQGRLIVARNQARIALGSGASHKIMVTLVSDEHGDMVA